MHLQLNWLLREARSSVCHKEAEALNRKMIFNLGP